MYPTLHITLVTSSLVPTSSHSSTLKPPNPDASIRRLRPNWLIRHTSEQPQLPLISDLSNRNTSKVEKSLAKPTEDSTPNQPSCSSKPQSSIFRSEPFVSFVSCITTGVGARSHGAVSGKHNRCTLCTNSSAMRCTNSIKVLGLIDPAVMKYKLCIYREKTLRMRFLCWEVRRCAEGWC